LQTIGSLAKQITPLQSGKDSAPTKLPQTLQNGGNTGQGQSLETHSKPIGRGLTASTLSNLPPVSLPAALAKDNPKQTLECVKASLPPQIRSSLKPVFDKLQAITHYDLTGTHGPREITQARNILAQSLTPITGTEALGLLKELKATTRPTPGTTDDLEAVLVAYLKRLKDYPADVIRHVLTTHDSPWWPAWHELKERLEMHTYRRRMMLEALKFTAA
jgi:hypothetical protein